MDVKHKCASSLRKPKSHKTAVNYLCLRCLGMAAWLWTFMMLRGPMAILRNICVRQRQSHINCRVSEVSVRPHKLAGCGDSWCWLTNQENPRNHFVWVCDAWVTEPRHATEWTLYLYALLGHCVCTVSTFSVDIIHLTNHLADFSEIWFVQFKFPHWEFLITSHFILHFRTITQTLRTAQICLVLCQFLSQSIICLLGNPKVDSSVWKCHNEL